MFCFESLPRTARARVIVGASSAVITRIGHPRAVLLLSEPELRRMAGLRRPADRNAFLASHALARLLAADTAGRATTEAAPGSMSQRCPTCNGQDHGRPSLPGSDVTVSWAHTDDLVAVAALRGATLPLGCDLERTNQPPVEAPGGRIDIGEWCRIECEVKAGLGSLDDRLAVRMEGSAEPSPRGLTWTERELRVAGRGVRLCVLAPGPSEILTWP